MPGWLIFRWFGIVASGQAMNEAQWEQGCDELLHTAHMRFSAQREDPCFKTPRESSEASLRRIADNQDTAAPIAAPRKHSGHSNRADILAGVVCGADTVLFRNPASELHDPNLGGSTVCR